MHDAQLVRFRLVHVASYSARENFCRMVVDQRKAAGFLKSTAVTVLN
jgi:hypothetical protein